MRTSSYPRIVRRRSTLHGWGVFTLDPIPRNTRIIHYAGERIPARESRAREAAHQARGHIWLFAINADGRATPRWWNIARFINHDCKPNRYTRVSARFDLRRARHRSW
jgi:SET domain-containing protein